MIPQDGGKFYAFGRVFSGTVQAGQKVTIMGANYNAEMEEDIYYDKAIQRTVSVIGNKFEQVDKVSAGNMVGLVGVDAYLLKSGTLTTSKQPFPIKTMKFSVSPVVRIAVSVKNPTDLPKLVQGLKRLSKTDGTVQCIMSESGEHIVAGVGELHLEICLNDLKKFMNGAELKVSPPVVPFRESCSETSDVCLSKSPNNHNRLYVTVEPLPEKLVDTMYAKKIVTKDLAAFGKQLVKEYDWDPNDAKKIWAVGPVGEETNIIIDATKGTQYMTEIKDNVVAGFLDLTSRGVICGEPLRGMKFSITDTTLRQRLEQSRKCPERIK